VTIAHGANTISRSNGAVDELYIAHVISATVLDASYSARVMWPLMRNESLAGEPSNAKKFPRWPALTAASVAETADLTQTALDTTSVTATVGEIGIQVAITDVLSEDDILAGVTEYGRQAGMAIADKMDADAAALLAGFSNVTGAATPANLSEANLLEAMSELDSRDAPDGNLVGVFHPRQLAQLNTSIITSGGNVWAGQAEKFGGRSRGYRGNYLGIDLYSTTNVPTGSRAATATFEGAVFVAGEALLALTKRAVRTELDRDASSRITEINITSRYAVAELVDAWGQTVFTDQTF